MMKSRIAIITIVICVLYNICIAAPQISTAVIDTQFAINGSGFGQNVNPAPLKFETFEGGVAGELLSSGGYWSHREINTATFFQTDRGISARQLQLGDGYQNWFYKNDIWTDDDEKGFISFWCKTVVDKAAGDADGWQQKMWTVIYDGSQYIDYGGWNTPCLYTAPQYNDVGMYDYATSVYNDRFVSQGTINGNDLYNTTGMWQLTTIEWMRSSIDGNDAVMYRYLSDPNNILPINKISKTGFNTRTSVNNRNLKAVQFGLMNTNSSGTANVTMYFDDIYFDNTWARVEIGDNSVYANCTHREIQPALTWTPTGITGTFNQGSFETGDTVYVFVVDENGVPSNGVAVVLGSEPAVADPVVEILTASGQTTTASVFTITGTATADTGQTISGVTCSGQTVTPDDGTWDEQAEAFTCLANLAIGENMLVFIGSDGTRTGQDSITVTRIKKTSKINGSATIKNATIHQ